MIDTHETLKASGWPGLYDRDYLFPRIGMTTVPGSGGYYFDWRAPLYRSSDVRDALMCERRRNA